MASRATGGASAKARVVVVDDHPVVREGLALLIAAQPDMEISGQAADVIEACRLVETDPPDVLVVDISLAGISGIELIKRIRTSCPSVRMLVSSIHDEGVYAERVLKAGALGYVNKREATRTIIEAIRRVRQGNVFLSQQMSDRLLSRAVGSKGTAFPSTSVDVLSDRELEVYESIGRGEATRDIAARLHLSTKTVETYRERIRKKLGLDSGTELTRCAMQWILGEA
ncbi:MAG: response regulator [Isosphaeraceae bacterium]